MQRFLILPILLFSAAAAQAQTPQGPQTPASQSEQDVVTALGNLESSTAAAASSARLLEGNLRRWNTDLQKQITDQKEAAAKREKEWEDYVAPMLRPPPMVGVK